MGRKQKEEGIYVYTWLMHFKKVLMPVKKAPHQERRMASFGDKILDSRMQKGPSRQYHTPSFRGKAEAEAETALSPSFSL